jgi:hypothetical protein
MTRCGWTTQRVKETAMIPPTTMRRLDVAAPMAGRAAVAATTWRRAHEHAAG